MGGMGGSPGYGDQWGFGQGNPLSDALNQILPQQQGSDPSALMRWWVEHGDEALLGAGGLLGPTGSGTMGNLLHDRWTDNYWGNNSWRSPNSGPVNHPDSVQGNTRTDTDRINDAFDNPNQSRVTYQPGHHSGMTARHGNTFGGGGWAHGTWNPSRIQRPNDTTTTISTSASGGGGDGPGLWDWIKSMFSK